MNLVLIYLFWWFFLGFICSKITVLPSVIWDWYCTKTWIYAVCTKKYIDFHYGYYSMPLLRVLSSPAQVFAFSEFLLLNVRDVWLRCCGYLQVILCEQKAEFFSLGSEVGMSRLTVGSLSVVSQKQNECSHLCASLMIRRFADSSEFVCQDFRMGPASLFTWMQTNLCVFTGFCSKWHVCLLVCVFVRDSEPLQPWKPAQHLASYLPLRTVFMNKHNLKRNHPKWSQVWRRKRMDKEAWNVGGGCLRPGEVAIQGISWIWGYVCGKS